MMEASDAPSAILCSSLILALGCCRALRDMGFKVGEDVSVVAHDDAINAIKPETLSPALTTTSSPIRAHGVRIAEMALQLVDGALPESCRRSGGRSCVPGQHSAFQGMKLIAAIAPYSHGAILR